jgi:hypothetical protein
MLGAGQRGIRPVAIQVRGSQMPEKGLVENSPAAKAGFHPPTEIFGPIVNLETVE